MVLVRPLCKLLTRRDSRICYDQKRFLQGSKIACIPQNPLTPAQKFIHFGTVLAVMYSVPILVIASIPRLWKKGLADEAAARAEAEEEEPGPPACVKK